MSPMAAASVVPTPPFVCPFCGLLCDDLPGPAPGVSLSVWGQGLQALCPRAAAGIETLARAEDGAPALVDGQPVELVQAVAEAARRLTAARRPVIGGLGGDVQAARAALALGDRVGARLVHANQQAAQRNLFAQQSRGAMTTTLAEARQRAEMLVLVGSDPTARFPRLLERLLTPDPVFADTAKRRLLLLGAPPPQRLPAGIVAQSVDCGGLDLFDSLAVLRASVAGLSVGSAQGGLGALAAQMRECRYGVLAWAVGDLDFPGADLLVESLNELVKSLNAKTRWGALPLAGNDGDLSANAAAAWQTGFPLPVEFAGGKVAYDPFPDYGDTDLLLWVGALPGVGAGRLPGAPAIESQIVVGAAPDPATLPARHVVIPVATPGVSDSGHLVRTDSVITLYAQAQLASGRPSAARALDDIRAVLEGARS